MKCFIISFNRLTCLKKQLEYLLPNKDLEVIIVDNNSTYQPLLDYYKTLDCKIVYSEKNYGHTVVWDLKLLDKYCPNEKYIITDSDIILDHVAKDYLEIMQGALDVFKSYNKIGLGLNTNNIPYDYPRRSEVLTHENKIIHRKEIGSRVVYECPVDTTFAMYREGYSDYSVWGTATNTWYGECKSLRMKKPYESTHLGWHIIKKTEEDEYYFKSIKNEKSGHWKI